MEWKYWIEEVLPANEPGMIREQLDHIGLRGWEAVTSWPAPDGVIQVLFKQQK
jgi:hypothetical protein